MVHNESGTRIIEFSSSVGYQALVVRKPSYIRVVLFNHNLEKLEWRQVEGYRLEDEKLAGIFVESYLWESVGVITLDEADLSKDEAREDEENRKDG